ncbi:hypothetical protein J6590_059592 [Homalodisca vitripennis]|nr:hypothetical protein J6590_059592 [Homalodisca vitripennis]
MSSDEEDVLILAAATCVLLCDREPRRFWITLILLYSDASSLESVAVRETEPSRSSEFRRSTLNREETIPVTERNREDDDPFIIEDAARLIALMIEQPSPISADPPTGRKRTYSRPYPSSLLVHCVLK